MQKKETPHHSSYRLYRAVHVQLDSLRSCQPFLLVIHEPNDQLLFIHRINGGESSVVQQAQSRDEDMITRQTIARNAGQQTTAGDRRPRTAVDHNTVLRLPGAGCSRNANPTSRAGVSLIARS